VSYDILIRGGRVIDGTGSKARTADVGIVDGKITEVGKLSSVATQTIDADGALVIPGFVDIHTHYDGQVSWDADLAPSSIQGVTTAVMGSCGVGFAPVRPTDHQRLIELMEGVEDIPGTALAEGLTWGWESFPEYMDRIDSFPHAIDFAVQIPHDALRVYVMGDRAVADEAATTEDIAAMRDLVGHALDAGAVGFSTGRSDNHRSAAGLPTPASEALRDELIGIASVFRGRRRGVVQAVSDFDVMTDVGRFDVEFELIEAMAEAAQRPLSISLMQRDHAADQWREVIRRAEAANARGLTMRLQVAPRGIGVLLGLDATFHPFMGFPSYRAIADRPLAERVARMRDPQFRARILSEKHQRLAGDGSSIPPLADYFLDHIDLVSLRLFRLGEKVNYEPHPTECLLYQANAAGVSVLEHIYDALLEQDGHALLYFPVYNFTEMNLDSVGEMLASPLALPGLSDGGAHVGTICDASFPTFLLSYWGRDRERGRIPIEKLVKMQCHDTARYIGFDDRGTVAPGQRADINIIDFDRLELTLPRMQADLPAGGKRLMQGADGILATMVAGQIVADHGALTGARPGRLVRSS
jgi:N-acyl-D-aspartate/D-glutamate deacylase